MSDYEFWEELSKIFNAVRAYQDKANEFNKAFIHPWIRLGNVFDKHDRARAEIEAFKKAIEINPTDGRSWYELGNLYFHTEAYDQAVEAFHKAIELEPQFGWPYSNLALTLVTQGKHADAIPLYQKSIELLEADKDKAMAWNRLGNVYRKLNQYEDALDAFHRADELDADNAGFRDELDEKPEPQPVAEQPEVTIGLSAIPGNPIQLLVDDNQAQEDAVEQASVVPVAAKAEDPSKGLITGTDQGPSGSPGPSSASPSDAKAAKKVTPTSETEDLLQADVTRSGQVHVETYTLAPESADSITETVRLASPNNSQDLGSSVPAHKATTNLKSAGGTKPAEVNPADIARIPLGSQAEGQTSEEELPKVDDLELPINVEDLLMGSNVSEVSGQSLRESTFVETGPAHAAYEEYLRDNHETLDMLAVTPDAAEQETAAKPELQQPNSKIDHSGEFQIEMDTKNAHVWNELGNVYFNNSSFDDAIVAYSKAIELDRWFAWPYSNLALAYVQKDRLAEAILLYQRSIELFTSEKDKAVSWNRLGNVYRRLNDYDHAIAAYQRADELDPENTTLSLQSRFSLLGNYSVEQKPAYVS